MIEWGGVQHPRQFQQKNYSYKQDIDGTGCQRVGQLPVRLDRGPASFACAFVPGRLEVASPRVQLRCRVKKAAAVGDA